MNKKVKEKFFDKLHDQLAREYRINPYAVKIMRSAILGRKLSPSQLVLELEKIIPRRTAKVKAYKDVIKFFKRAGINEVQDLLQKTKFDK